MQDHDAFGAIVKGFRGPKLAAALAVIRQLVERRGALAEAREHVDRVLGREYEDHRRQLPSQ